MLPPAARLVCGIGLFVLMCGAVAEAAPLRLAIIGSEGAIQDDLTLAEVALADSAGFTLLDRKDVSKVLAEQKLAASGLVDADQAIRAGRVLKVELFAILEVPAEKDASAAFVVFDAPTGVKLWDASIPGKTAEERSPPLLDALKKAAAKRSAATRTARTVSFLTVRNADLPRSMDQAAEVTGYLLERWLVQASNIAVLERKRLQQVVQEQALPSKEPPSPLLASLRLVELQLSRGQAGEGIHVVARVTDGMANEIATVSADTKEQDARALAEAIYPALTRALEAPATARGEDRAREGERFYWESHHYWRHKEFDRAALAAEAAYALDPANRRSLRWLVWVLGQYATELVDPGHSTTGGPATRPIEPEPLQRSFEVASQGIGLMSVQFNQLTQDPRWPDVAEDMTTSFYSIYLSKICALKDQPPATQQKISEVVAAYRALQEEEVLPYYRKHLDRDKVFGRYTGQIASWFLLDAFGNYSKVRTDWADDIERVLREWTDAAEERKVTQHPQDFRSSKYMLNTINHRQQHVPLSAEQADALQRCNEYLRQQSDPLLRYFGKLMELTFEPAYRRAKALPPPQHEARILEIEKFIVSVQPYIIDPEVNEQVRAEWIDIAMQLQFQLDLATRARIGRNFANFLLAHKLYDHRVMTHALMWYGIQGQEDPQSAIQFIDRLIPALNSGELKIAADVQKASVHDLETRRRAIAEKLGLAAGTMAPWETARTIIDLREEKTEDGQQKTGIRRLIHPLVRDRTVYVLGIDWDNVPGDDLRKPGRTAVSLLSFGLDDSAPAQLAMLTMSDLPILDVIETSTLDGAKFLPAALMTDDLYIAGTSGKGLVVFPLKGGAVRTIGDAQGLPSNHVQALLWDGQRIYAWLGRRGTDAYLVRLKPDGSELETLVSSRRAVHENLMDRLGPVRCDLLLLDRERKRILIRIETGGNSDSGFYQFDPETGKFSFPVKSWIGHGHPSRAISAHSALLYEHTIFSTDATTADLAAVFDTKDDKINVIYRENYRLSKMAYPFTLRGDELWMTSPWGRLNVRTGVFEHFTPLRRGDKNFQPGINYARVSDEEMVVGDFSGLWLLKFKPAE